MTLKYIHIFFISAICREIIPYIPYITLYIYLRADRSVVIISAKLVLETHELHICSQPGWIQALGNRRGDPGNC